MDHIVVPMKHAPGVTLQFHSREGTDSSQAITLHEVTGEVTSSTADLAADTVETITVTNKYSTSTCKIFLNVRGGGAAAGGLSASATPSAGSFTIKVRNNTPSTAANAAYVVDFVIIDKVS